MKSFRDFLLENAERPFEKNPRIGWWRDQHPDHYVMYHGTHESRLDSIRKHGIKAPDHGPTKGWVSMTHDPHTAHGYASMTGGESSFRAAGSKAKTVPHHERVVLVAHVPKKWAHENMNHELRGNMDGVRHNLTDKSRYDAHRASGRPDHEYYQTTELRFKHHVPAEFIVGHMRKVKKT